MTDSDRIQIAQLQPAMNIQQIFMISQPQLRTTNRGDYYIAAFLSDKTGKLNGRLWQANETIFHSLPTEGFVWVRGRSETYQNAMQLVIDEIKPVDSTKVDFSEFMPSTDKDITQMWNRVLEILSTVENPYLKQLLHQFLSDKELMAKFRAAPAAIALHHAYIGGLLEHTLGVMELGLNIAPLYPLDKDMLITALFLHDMAKTTELEYSVSFKYSDQGRLMGHLVRGAILIEECIKKIETESGKPFPRQLADSLEHIILSHHGIREYGCPVLPTTPEAFAVHFLDNLDSKMALTFGEIESDTNGTDWTNYVRSIEAPVYKIRPDDIK